MAKLLMGSVVTKAVGKLGGHCFRIHGNTQILQRNPLPSKRNGINKNRAMKHIQANFQNWSVLAQDIRDEWARLSNLYPVIDRFGNPKTLSGRQFYTRSAINASCAGSELPDVFTFDGTIPVISFSSVGIDTATTTFNINDWVLDSPGHIEVRIISIYGTAQTPQPKACKLGIYFEVDVYNPSAMYADIVANGFTFVPGMNYCVWLRQITHYGMPGVWNVSKCIAT